MFFLIRLKYFKDSRSCFSLVSFALNFWMICAMDRMSESDVKSAAAQHIAANSNEAKGPSGRVPQPVSNRCLQYLVFVSFCCQAAMVYWCANGIKTAVVGGDVRAGRAPPFRPLRAGDRVESVRAAPEQVFTEFYIFMGERMCGLSSRDMAPLSCLWCSCKLIWKRKANTN